MFNLLCRMQNKKNRQQPKIRIMRAEQRITQGVVDEKNVDFRKSSTPSLTSS